MLVEQADVQHAGGDAGISGLTIECQSLGFVLRHADTIGVHSPQFDHAAGVAGAGGLGVPVGRPPRVGGQFQPGFTTEAQVDHRGGEARLGRLAKTIDRGAEVLVRANAVAIAAAHDPFGLDDIQFIGLLPSGPMGELHLPEVGGDALACAHKPLANGGVLGGDGLGVGCLHASDGHRARLRDATDECGGATQAQKSHDHKDRDAGLVLAEA